VQDKIARLIAEIEMGTPVSPEGDPGRTRIYAAVHETNPITRSGSSRSGLRPARTPKAGCLRHPTASPTPAGRHLRPRRRLPCAASIGRPERRTTIRRRLGRRRNGFVGVTMSYRLAPQHRFPAGPDDVAAAVAWVAREHCRAWRRPQRHRATRAIGRRHRHVAGYGRPRRGATRGVRALALIRGVLRLRAFEKRGATSAYLGDDPAEAAAAASSFGARRPESAVLVCVSHFDTRHSTTSESASPMPSTSATAGARISVLAAHNHLSPDRDLNASRHRRPDSSPIGSPSSCASIRPGRAGVLA